MLFPNCESLVIRKALLFVLVFAALQFSWQGLGDRDTGHVLIARVIVAPAALIVRALTPDVQVNAVGTRLVSARASINIINGCDGMDMLFLLFAGFAVAPLPWRPRLIGTLAGLPLVYLLNQARIVGLFYAIRTHSGWFDPLHGFIAPVVMVVLIALYFYGWLYRGQAPARPSA